MKKILTILSISFMILFTFSLTGCNNKDTNDKKAQRVADEFLDLYYKIGKAEFEYYDKMMSGTKPKDIAEFTESYETNTEKFKAFMTDSAYEDFYATRMSYLRIHEAFMNNYYVEVNDIEIEKYYERNDKDEKEPMLSYYYNIELVLTSISDNTTKTIKGRKQITLLKIDDEWKIKSYQPIQLKATPIME